MKTVIAIWFLWISIYLFMTDFTGVRRLEAYQKFLFCFYPAETRTLIRSCLLYTSGMLKMSVEKYGQTLVMITHDEDIAQIADRILVIEDGKVAEFS